MTRGTQAAERGFLSQKTLMRPLVGHLGWVGMPIMEGLAEE